MTAHSTTTTHVVDGVEVQLPMVVGHATGGLLVFTGDVRAIAARLPSDLTPVQLLGGRGVVLLLAVRYVDNPLGAYDELVVGLAARPVGMRGGAIVGLTDLLRGRVGAWIEHMAVDQAFTREAGEQIWGYPKTLDELAFAPDGRRATMTWSRDGERILDVGLPTRGVLPAPTLPVTTYTRIGGTTMRTSLCAQARGVGTSLRGASVTLGDHVLADQLRALGLDRRPVAAAWLDRIRMEFSAATPLHGDAS